MEDVQSTVSETTEKLNNLRLKLFSMDIFNYLLGSYKKLIGIIHIWTLALFGMYNDPHD